MNAAAWKALGGCVVAVLNLALFAFACWSAWHGEYPKACWLILLAGWPPQRSSE